MTLREKAKEMFGEKHIDECPAQLFGIACMADNSFPDCGHETCWKFHQTEKIEYKENPKDIFKQQILGTD